MEREVQGEKEAGSEEEDLEEEGLEAEQEVDWAPEKRVETEVDTRRLLN